MSCVTGIQSRPTQAQIDLANKQKLSYSSPPPRDSLTRRLWALAESKSANIRSSAASSYRAPVALQRVLAKDTSVAVRSCLARNRHADPAVLTALAEDQQEVVRSYAATNDATPKSVLRVLTEDPDPTVRYLAQWNLNTDQED